MRDVLILEVLCVQTLEHFPETNGQIPQNELAYFLERANPSDNNGIKIYLLISSIFYELNNDVDSCSYNCYVSVFIHFNKTMDNALE